MIKDASSIFRLNKEVDEKPTKYVRNLFRLKNQDKAINDRILRCIRNL